MRVCRNTSENSCSKSAYKKHARHLSRYRDVIFIEALSGIITSRRCFGFIFLDINRYPDFDTAYLILLSKDRVPFVQRSVLSDRGIVATLSPNFLNEIRYRRRRAGRYGKLFPCARARDRGRDSEKEKRETSTPHLACHWLRACRRLVEIPETPIPRREAFSWHLSRRQVRANVAHFLPARDVPDSNATPG